jgi:hypothetical protein
LGPRRRLIPVTITVGRRDPAIFERSRLKNEYRSILNQAREDGEVLIRDAGDENLYLVRADRYGAMRESYLEAQDFAQFIVALQGADDAKRAPSAISLGRLSWAKELSAPSFREFVREYSDSFFRAINGGDWNRHRQLLIEWRDTAAVESDPDLRQRVMSTGEPQDHEDLPRPSTSD